MAKKCGRKRKATPLLSFACYVNSLAREAACSVFVCVVCFSYVLGHSWRRSVVATARLFLLKKTWILGLKRPTHHRNHTASPYASTNINKNKTCVREAVVLGLAGVTSYERALKKEASYASIVGFEPFACVLSALESYIWIEGRLFLLWVLVCVIHTNVQRFSKR